MITCSSTALTQISDQPCSSRLLSAICLFMLTPSYCRPTPEPDITGVSSSSIFCHILLSINIRFLLEQYLSGTLYLKPASTRIPSPPSRRSSVTRPERCTPRPPIAVIRECGLTIIELELERAACSTFQTCILNSHQGHTMCQSMVDIQPAAAEIRRGIKKDRRQIDRKKLQGKNIMVCPITQGDHNYSQRHSPQGPLRENTTSSTKPEVHNVFHGHQRRTEPRYRVTPTGNFVKFGRRVFEIHERTDRRDHGRQQTLTPVLYKRVHRNTSQPCQGRNNNTQVYQQILLWNTGDEWSTRLRYCEFHERKEPLASDCFARGRGSKPGWR